MSEVQILSPRPILVALDVVEERASWYFQRIAQHMVWESPVESLQCPKLFLDRRICVAVDQLQDCNNNVFEALNLFAEVVYLPWRPFNLIFNRGRLLHCISMR